MKERIFAQPIEYPPTLQEECFTLLPNSSQLSELLENHTGRKMPTTEFGMTMFVLRNYYHFSHSDMIREGLISPSDAKLISELSHGKRDLGSVIKNRNKQYKKIISGIAHIISERTIHQNEHFTDYQHRFQEIIGQLSFLHENLNLTIDGKPILQE